MTALDKVVVMALGALVALVLVRAVLEAAAALMVPALIVAACYGGFRAWQLGWVQKIVGKKDKESGSVRSQVFVEKPN